MAICNGLLFRESFDGIGSEVRMGEERGVVGG
jgi:hypothetical protein